MSAWIPAEERQSAFEQELPPYTQNGTTNCPKCGGEAKTFNCGCVRCDQDGCYYLYQHDGCEGKYTFMAPMGWW